MKNLTNRLLGLTALSAMAFTAACSDDISQSTDRRGVSDFNAAVSSQIDSDAAALRNAGATGRPGNMQVRDGIFIGKDGFRTGRGDPLPRRFETSNGITLKFGDDIRLPEFVSILQDATGMRVDIRDLYAAPLSGSADEEGGAEAGADSTEDAGGGGGATAVTIGGSSHATEVPFRVDHKGSLSSLLDKVANQIGADWEYSGGRIKFLGPQTMTYTIWALSGDVTSSASLGGGNATTFGASAPATTNVNRTFDYWGSVEAGIAAVVPADGARYAINRSAGTVTVTGFQAVHERVAGFVAQENQRMSRQVAVKVDVLAFTTNSSDERSTSLNLALSSISAGLNMNLITPANSIDQSTGLGLQILDGDLANSTGIINALAREGRVSVLKSTSVIAGNNNPTPVTITTEKAYLSGITVETTDEGTSTSFETGIINTGMNLVITPRIMSAGDVMLTYNMQISELKGIEQFEAEGTQVQLPEMETRNFMQTMNIGSGDSIVVAAFDGSRTARNAAAPFMPQFWGLGGQDGYTSENTKIVVLMTPVVIEGQNKPRAPR
jgi:type IVB pilus formation R64 PilN family outer membrane protein